jgi:undecaprenyl-diphosphatase
MDWFLQLDSRLFLAVNGLHTESLDGIMWWISGRITWWPFYLLLLGYLGWIRRWGVVPLILALVIVITLTDQTSVHFFKNVFQRLRPCHEPSLEGMVHLVNNKCGGQFGFISSHATNAFGVAMLISLLIRKRWIFIIMIAWAVLISYSRVYLGMHYPGDVVAGAIWGAGCGWLVYRLYLWTMGKLPQNWWVNVVHPE